MTFDAVMEWLRTDWIDIAVLCVTLLVGYVIFGIAGFGAVLIVAPVMALLRMPVATIVPLIALLDLIAAVINGITLSEKIDRKELAWLIPLMIVGSITGATLLLSLPARQMMIALSVFVVAYGSYGLFAPPIRARFGRPWVFPFGLVGGLFSGMFGSGGFIYSIYLSRRLIDKDEIRGTQSALIGLSAFTRVVIFLLAGVYADLRLLLLATAGLPALALGVFIGHHLTLRLSHEQFLRMLYVVLIGAGAVLMLKAFNF